MCTCSGQTISTLANYRSSPFKHANYFDPLSVEIEAAEAKFGHHMDTACDFSEADEAKITHMLIPRYMPTFETEPINNKIVLSPLAIFSLFLRHEDSGGSSQINNPTLIETSRWTKAVLMRACKVFGINRVGLESEILSMVLRMEQKRQEQIQIKGKKKQGKPKETL